MNPASAYRKWWRDWEPDPILVKEARQGVRSQTLPGVICFLLIALASLLIWQVGNQQPPSPGSDVIFMGKKYFQTCLLILAASGLAAAGVLFHRTAQECVPERRDMLYITTLRPNWIVRGKFLAAMAFSMVLFCVSLPYVVVSYFLRGIGLPDIGLHMLLLVALMATVNLWAIAVGGSRANTVVKWMVWVGGLLPLGLVWVILQEGGASFSLKDWSGFLGTMALILWILYAVAVFCFSPANTARSAPLRLTLVGVGLGLWPIGWLIGQWEVGLILGFPLMLVSAVMVFHSWNRIPARMVVSGQRWRTRVVRVCPLILGENMLAGFVFTLLMVLVYLGVCYCYEVVHGGRSLEKIASVMGVSMGYLLAYILTVRAVLEGVIHRYFPAVRGALIFFVVAVVVSLFSVMTGAMFHSSHGLPPLAIGSIFLFVNAPFRDWAMVMPYHFFALASWWVVLAAANWRWIVGSIRDLRAPERACDVTPTGGEGNP